MAPQGLGFKEEMSGRSNKTLKKNPSYPPAASIFILFFLNEKELQKAPKVPSGGSQGCPISTGWGMAGRLLPDQELQDLLLGMQRSFQYSLNFYLLDKMSWMEFTWCQAASLLGLLKPAWASPS